MSQRSTNSVIENFQESIFSRMSALAIKHEAINLAQGFPDFEGPQWMVDLVAASFLKKKNQYMPSMGLFDLRESVSQFYQKFYQTTYAPTNQILITQGATEAIYLACQALLNPGDEAIIFAPYYDSYPASILMAGGVPIVVQLLAPDFSLKMDAIRKVCTRQTKMLILNSPHNPTGRVFTSAEILEIVELSIEFDFYIVSDEVYEFITFESKFKSIADIEEVKDRVIRISSVGKTLSFTGWKLGWAVGPSKIIRAMHLAHQFINFCVPGPIQVAVASILISFDKYLVEMQSMYREKRDFFIQEIEKRGAKVLVPEGSYFVLVKVPNNHEMGALGDFIFCEKMVVDLKLAAIPISAFYPDETYENGYVRFCFAKEKTTLQDGAQRFPQGKI